jgi:5,10-methylenetetrahydrofolate reductase
VDSSASGGFLEIELESLEKKIQCGVSFVVTKPVFDLHVFGRFLKRVDMTKVAVIPTVMLLKSAGMARYIDRNIKGVSIPSDMIRGIQKSPDKPAECIRLAAELISKLKDMGVAGVMVSTLGWENRLPQIIDQARL